MRNIKLIKNPFWLFLPFLIFFIIIILKFQTDGMKTHGDESRYYQFAQNLIHGFYSPPSPKIDLTNGPGYPIILMPFVALGLPVISMKLMNAVFYYLSIILLFKSLQQIVSFRKALIFSLFWACYYNSYQDMLYVLTESFTCLLISLIIFTLIKAFKQERPGVSKKYLWLSGFSIGYLVLTKIIFGYVLVFLLIGCGFLWIINRRTGNYKKRIIILFIAFMITIPYLIYTYSLTGKILYWGTPGGDSLYWMSTPYEDEYGDWYGELNIKLTSKEIASSVPGYLDSLKLHHQKDYEEIFKYEGIQRSDAFERIAINNIKSHPFKYIKNCISNIGRLLFSYPYSYTIQNNKTLLRLPLNGIIVVFSAFCLILTFFNWRKVIFPIRFILFFILLYLGLSTLVSAQIRMFTIIVPMLIFWIAFIFQKSVRINFKFDKKNDEYC